MNFSLRLLDSHLFYHLNFLLFEYIFNIVAVHCSVIVVLISFLSLLVI